MDQLISCQDIYHIYKHLLSIIIHLKFQDKDGCSRKGSREFLVKFQIVRKRYRCDMDHRGVPYKIFLDGGGGVVASHFVSFLSLAYGKP